MTRRLAESESRANMVVDTAHDAFIGVDSDDRIIMWNAQAERVFGWTREEATGLRLGRNSYLATGWLPPDPPPGHGVHRYAFQVFALAPGATFDGTPGRDAVLEAIREHGLASGCLIGTYERPDTSIRTPADTDAVPIGVAPLAT